MWALDRLEAYGSFSIMRSFLEAALTCGVGRKASNLANHAARFRSIALALWAVWALSVASPAWATSPLSTAEWVTTPLLRGYGNAIADLDGDGRLDLATVTLKSRGPNTFRYQVDLDLSSRIGPSSFSVSAGEGGLRIVPRDVDGDGDLDLVITNARSLVPVGVWINDGHGGFTEGNPTAYPGSIWTEDSGMSTRDTQGIFPATVPQSRWLWLDFSKGFRFRSELPIEPLRLCHAISNFPEVAVGQPRTRSPPCSLPPQTS